MISVLTVNFHSSRELAQLAQSLVEFPSIQGVELIVTNNSPSDPVDAGGAAGLSHRVNDSRNVGFARGINRALHDARGELLLVANPDLRVTSGALDAAAAFLAQHKNVGVLLPRLVYPDGRVQPSVRRFYSWPAALYARSPLRPLMTAPKFFRRYLYADEPMTRPTDVDWGLGGAMFLRRSDFPDGKIFDERFFLYFEDVDLCYRTWQRGRRVVYCPHVRCVHAHRRMSRNPFSLSGWRHLRSFMRFVTKHRGLPTRPKTP